MLVSRRLLLRAAPLAAALGPLAACSSGTASDPHSSAGPAPASLVLDTAAWSHDADNDVYYQLGLSYVTAPQDTAHETLGIFVPGAYLSAVDNKAAVRYLRYNAAGLPGDAERVFVFGHSGGGAQSAVMGASGDSALYTPYLEALGAATAGADGGPLSDAIAGAMCWCPITRTRPTPPTSGTWASSPPRALEPRAPGPRPTPRTWPPPTPGTSTPWA